MGTRPSRALRAMCLMARIFPRENPARRIFDAGIAATAAGLGNPRPGNSAMKRPRMASAARPWICWCATARTRVSNGCWLRIARPQGPTRRMSARIVGSTLERCRTAGLLIDA